MKHSKKSIPLSSKIECKLQPISQEESVTKKMIQKTSEVQDKFDYHQKENYGFRSKKCTPTVEQLMKFEEHIKSLIQKC